MPFLMLDIAIRFLDYCVEHDIFWVPPVIAGLTLVIIILLVIHFG